MLLSQLTYLQAQGYPVKLFIPKLMLSLSFFSVYLLGRGIVVFLSEQRKVAQGTWALTDFWLCWRNTDVSSFRWGWDFKI